MPFFHADDGKHAYFVHAYDLAHAKQILVDADVEIHDPDGVPRAADHPSLSEVEHPTLWNEIDGRRAANLTPHGMLEPLSDLPLGQYARVAYPSDSRKQP